MDAASAVKRNPLRLDALPRARRRGPRRFICCAMRRASRCQRSASGAASPVGAAANENRIARLGAVRASGERGAVLAVVRASGERGVFVGLGARRFGRRVVVLLELLRAGRRVRRVPRRYFCRRKRAATACFPK